MRWSSLKFWLELRDRKLEVEVPHFKSGGQGDLYDLKVDGKVCILKVYTSQEEGQLRYRELSDKLDLLPSPPKQIERGKMIDCGSAFDGTDTWPAVVFPKVNGKPLFDPMGIEESLISRNEANEATRLGLALDLLEGVQYLHMNGIVHSDLSPNNVLVTDSLPPELTIIDIDGAGILESRKKGWKVEPLVIGHSRMGGFPPPSEFWEDKVVEQSDYWWSSMLTYYILTSNSPFFFLDEVTPPSLLALGRLFEGRFDEGWPPNYEIARKHPAFRSSIGEGDYNAMQKYVGNLMSSNHYFLTLVPGYTDVKRRTTPYDLYWELKMRNDPS